MGDPTHIDRINDLLAGLVRWVLDHRWLPAVLAVVLVLCGVLASSNLHVDNSLNAYFLDDDPAYRFYKAFRDEYENDEFVYIVYTAKPDIFDLGILEKTRALVADLATIPHVKDVTAITNLEFVEAGQDGTLEVFGLMDEFPGTQADADRLKRKLAQHPLYQRAYLSDDGRYAAILCDIETAPDAESGYQSTIGSSLLAVLAKPEYHDFDFWPVGQPLIVSAINDVAMREVVLFTGVVAAIITALLLVFFRQAKGAVALQLCYLLGLLVVVATLSLNEFPVTMLALVAFPLLYAIAVADGIHVVEEYQAHLRSGHGNRDAILATVRLIGASCLFTTLTTAAGFASLVISPLPVIYHFGLATTIGVLALFGICFTVLPVFLSLSGAKSEALFASERGLRTSIEGRIHGVLDRCLAQVARCNIRHHRRILSLAAVLSLLSLVGAAQIKTDASWLHYFGDEIEVFRDYAFVDAAMAGSENFEILLDSKQADGVATRHFLHTLERIQRYAESQDHFVRKTMSVVDIIKDIGKALHANDPAAYRLPASDPEVSQYLLLYELAGGEELEKIVSADLATARLTILTKSMGSLAARRFHDDLVAFIESALPDDYAFAVTGLSYMQLASLHHMNVTMMWSILLALTIISLLMVLVFRSLAIGLVSLLPNVFPVVATMGIMGLAGIPLDFSKTVLACVAIGIAVDDTIHLLLRYRHEFTILGSYERALEAAMRGVGHAVTRTTIVLVIPLSACMFSEFATMSYFGMLMSICIIVALLADYFITPSLILALRPFGEERERAEHPTAGPLPVATPASGATRKMGLEAHHARSRHTDLRCWAAGALLLGASTVLPTSRGADAAQEQPLPSGSEIVRRVNARDEGRHVVQHLEMELIDRTGKKRVRRTRGYRKDYGEERRTVLFYESPANVRGTGLLTYDYHDADRDDDQWLYLPALRKVRRVAAGDRGDYFLGTDLTYEDMKKGGKIEREDFSHTTIGVEDVDGRDCYVVEHTPVSEKIARELGYGRVRSYVDPEIWMARKAEFWDTKNRHLKTIHSREIRQVDGIWTAHRMVAENHQSGHQTIFTFSGVDYGSPVEDDVFTQRALERGP